MDAIVAAVYLLFRVQSNREEIDDSSAGYLLALLAVNTIANCTCNKEKDEWNENSM